MGSNTQTLSGAAGQSSWSPSQSPDASRDGSDGSQRTEESPFSLSSGNLIRNIRTEILAQTTHPSGLVLSSAVSAATTIMASLFGPAGFTARPPPASDRKPDATDAGMTSTCSLSPAAVSSRPHEDRGSVGRCHGTARSSSLRRSTSSDTVLRSRGHVWKHVQDHDQAQLKALASQPTRGVSTSSVQASRENGASAIDDSLASFTNLPWFALEGEQRSEVLSRLALLGAEVVRRPISRQSSCDLDRELILEKRIMNDREMEHQLALKEGRWPRLRTYHFDDIPHYLQDNEFIQSGYRVCYSYVDNWRSLFMLHNETGNIWTHLLGFLLIIGLMIYVHLTLPERAHLSDHLVFAGYFLSAAFCLLFSTLFHTHYCHSRSAFVAFGCLDYAGISTLICGSGCIVTYFGFYCEAITRTTWMVISISFALVGIVGPLYKKWAHRSFRRWRTLIYLSSGCATALPVLHFLATNGFPNGMEMDHYGWFLLMVCMYLLGALIYATRIPERPVTAPAVPTLLPTHLASV